MITLQLRELEADGIVKRTVFPEVPPKVEYEPTELGQSLASVLLSMRDWGEHLKRDRGDARWWADRRDHLTLSGAPPFGAGRV
jgi:DNA-binding HxlR family transcriptional regulator